MVPTPQAEVKPNSPSPLSVGCAQWHNDFQIKHERVGGKDDYFILEKSGKH